jgi:hypothetical protein
VKRALHGTHRRAGDGYPLAGLESDAGHGVTVGAQR